VVRPPPRRSRADGSHPRPRVPRAPRPASWSPPERGNHLASVRQPRGVGRIRFLRRHGLVKLTGSITPLLACSDPRS
jgi:hypothetical protein